MMESEFYTPSQEAIDRVALIKRKQAGQSIRSILIEEFRKVEKTIASDSFVFNSSHSFDMLKIPDEYAPRIERFFTKLGVSWETQKARDGGLVSYHYGVW